MSNKSSSGWRKIEKSLLTKFKSDNRLTRADYRVMMLAILRELTPGEKIPLSVRFTAKGINLSKRSSSDALKHLCELGYLHKAGWNDTSKAACYRITIPKNDIGIELQADTTLYH